MHRKILCLFFFTGVLLTAQAAVSYMTIEKTNGEKFSFLLAETPVITFVGDDLVVNGSSETSYAVTDVKNYHFTETDQTVVEKQTSELLRFVYSMKVLSKSRMQLLLLKYFYSVRRELPCLQLL